MTVVYIEQAYAKLESSVKIKLYVEGEVEGADDKTTAYLVNAVTGDDIAEEKVDDGEFEFSLTYNGEPPCTIAVVVDGEESAPFRVIDKNTNEPIDAAECSGKVVDLTEVSAPGPLDYPIPVDNTGNADLTNVVLGDVFAGGARLDSGDANNNSILETTETWTYTCSLTAVAGTTVNTATATTDQTGPDTDTASYLGQDPGLTIEKEASDSATGPWVESTLCRPSSASPGSTCRGKCTGMTSARCWAKRPRRGSILPCWCTPPSNMAAIPTRFPPRTIRSFITVPAFPGTCC